MDGLGIRNRSVKGAGESQRVPSESLTELRDKNTASFQCLAQLSISRSSILAHCLYEFPPLSDPGVATSLEFNPKEDTYESTQVYASKCKELRIPIMQRVMKSLTTSRLDLRYCGLGLKQIKAITSALTLNNCVKELILEENYMKAEGVFHISEMLRDNNCIEHLNLSRCDMHVKCCEELVEGLSTTQSVKVLDLSKNNFGNSGLDKFLRCLADTPSIVKLDLSHNLLDEDVAAGFGVTLAENQSIEELNLSWNNFNTRKSMHLLCKGLAVTDKLKVLNLSWNGIIDDDTFLPVYRYIIKTRTLEHLDISNNCMKGKVLQMVKRAILNNSSLISINLSSNLISPDEAFDLAQVFIIKTKQPLKLQYMDMENIVVNKDFLPRWKMITKQGKGVRVGHVLANYEILGPNITKILFDRIRFLANKQNSLKSRREFGHFLCKFGTDIVNKSNFNAAITRSKLPKLKKHPELIKELLKIYTARYDDVNVKEMKEDYYKLYPYTTLPPKKIDKKLSKKSRKTRDKSEGGQKEESTRSKSKLKFDLPNSIDIPIDTNVTIVDRSNEDRKSVSGTFVLDRVLDSVFKSTSAVAGH